MIEEGSLTGLSEIKQDAGVAKEESLSGSTGVAPDPKRAKTSSDAMPAAVPAAAAASAVLAAVVGEPPSAPAGNGLPFQRVREKTAPGEGDAAQAQDDGPAN